MIEVTGLNSKVFYLNEDNIEKLEQVPETVITMINDKKYLVKDDVEEILDKIVSFKKRFMIGHD